MTSAARVAHWPHCAYTAILGRMMTRGRTRILVVQAITFMLRLYTCRYQKN